MPLRARPILRRLSSQLALLAIGAVWSGLFVAYLLVMRTESRLAFDIAEQLAAQQRVAVADASAAAGAEPATARRRLIDALPTGHHLLDGDDEVLHVVVRVADGQRWVAVYGDAAHQRRSRSVGRSLLAVGAALTAAVLLTAGWWTGVLLTRRPALRRRQGQAMAQDEPPSTAQDPRSALSIGYAAYEREAMGSRQQEKEFIANVAHELRTPLTLVLTTCELLRESSQLGERERLQVLRITNAAEHMDELVRSFLVLARDGHYGRSERVELRACVLDAFAPHWDELRERGIEVAIHVGPEISILASRDAVAVVVSNLVKNAIKYTETGGITCHFLGQVLYVSDTGCGIADEDVPKVFTPFFRTRDAAESGHSGLGLGLAIVKRVCQHHGWPVRLRSRLGKGTTVQVEFASPSTLFG